MSDDTKFVLQAILVILLIMGCFFGLIYGGIWWNNHSCHQFGVKFGVETVSNGGICYVVGERLMPINVFLWLRGAQ